MELGRRTSLMIIGVALSATLAGILSVALQVLPGSSGAVLAGPYGGYLGQGVAVAALHPLNGALILVLAIETARQAWLARRVARSGHDASAVAHEPDTGSLG